MSTATIYRPRMISIPASPYCELARWTLDRYGIPYREECHVPVLRAAVSRECGAGTAGPVVDTGETRLSGAREVVDYYEARAPLDRKLYPADSGLQKEAKSLVDYLHDKFGAAVLSWVSAHLLQEARIMIPLWTAGAPLWERVTTRLFYPILAARVRKRLGIAEDTIPLAQQLIESTLSEVEKRLADGRRFLMGQHFSAPDLAYAALAAPIILPAEYGGPAPNLADLPAAIRSAIEQWRARPAGQFILRLYREERPQRVPDLIALKKHSSGRTLKDQLANCLVQPAVLRPVFGFLRRFFPVLVLGKRAIITRHQDVIEVLKRDTDFTIREVNAPKIDQIDGPFILGMDASPQYDAENGVLHEAVRQEDLGDIRAFVADSAKELIDAARPRGRIDVVNGLARVVPVRLLASYFGMPGPDEPTMMRWMRDIFHYIFADLTNADSVEQDALHASSELRRHMDAQIALRKSRPGGQNHNDDVLGRLLALQDASHPWLDNNAVRRNLAGVIVGAVDTTSKFVTLAIDELLRRPESLAEARDAALRGDIESVRCYAWEAVRFNPHHPLQVRFSARENRIAHGQPRSKNIPRGTMAYVATLSAMFDPEVFQNPGEFNAQRQVEYLHFGYGMHTCFGRAINGVQIPELLAALLRLPNLRRASGSAGRILYDGPFPNRLVLEFDA